jgi:hypothetical protein
MTSDCCQSQPPNGVVNEGAIFNPVNQKYIANKLAYGGRQPSSLHRSTFHDILITVEAKMTNASSSIKSGPQNVTVNLWIQVVADGG